MPLLLDVPTTDAAPEVASRPPATTAPAIGPVLAAVLARIELGEILPGEQLRQDDLAAALGVSRAPVREALRVLEHDGVAVHHPNRGYFVARRSAAELRQLHRMLELLEGELLSRLAWPDEAAVDGLRRTNAALAAVVELADPAPAIAANRRFHDALADLADVDLVRTEVRRLWTLAAPSVAVHLADPSARARAVEQHAEIVDALANRRRLALLRAAEAHRADESRGLDASLLPPSLRA